MDLEKKFEELEEISLHNTKKVLRAFQKHNVSSSCFAGTNGYGYADVGREKLGEVFAEVFGAQAGIVSPRLVSGTHTLITALFGLLKSGDIALSISGKPYDTLTKVINEAGGFSDYNIKFENIPLKNNDFDKEEIEKKIKELNPKIIYMQRSRGYDWRESFNISRMKEIFKFVRTFTKAPIVVDNCYGEFTEKLEPTNVGADIAMGSLIKNPGGGLTPTGGYIVGNKDLIDLINGRLTIPGTYGELGSYENGYRLYFQGLFIAPHTVKEALKGVILLSETLRAKGIKCLPEESSVLSDIVCSIEFGTKQKMIDFCNKVQQNSPIDSFITCEPSEMAGYDTKIIMAAGTFVQGATIELSCDGRVEPPYIVYFQGGLTYEHVKILVENL